MSEENLKEEINNQHIQAERNYLDKLINTARVIILVLDNNGCIVTFNKYMEEISGYLLEEVKGKEWFDTFLPQRDREKIKKLFSAAIGGTQTKGNVNPIVTKNGEEREIEWYDDTLKDDEGHTTGILSIGKDITESKKVLEESNVLRKQIEFILGATSTNIDIIDSDFNLVYVDPEWQKIYGDYKGQKCYKYFADRADMCQDCGIPQALETKQKVIAEEVLPKEGNRPIQVTIMPFKNEKGEWLVAEVNVDISERKKLEEILKSKEEEYRIRFEGALDGIVVCNAETGVIIDCNNAILELLHRDKAELIGKSQKILHPPEEHIGKFSRTYEQHLKEKEGQVLEAKVVTKEGEIKDVAIKANVFDFQGKKMIQGIFRDITDQNKVQEQIIKAKEDWEKTFDSMADGVSIHDAQMTVLQVNDALCKLTGKGREEIVGRKCFNLFHNSDNPIENCPLEKCRDTKKQEYLEVYEPSINKYLAVTTSPVLDDKGDALKVIHTIRDITSFKKAEEGTKKTLDDLQQFKQATVDRENKMIKLKKEVNALCEQLGKPALYDLSFLE